MLVSGAVSVRLAKLLFYRAYFSLLSNYAVSKLRYAYARSIQACFRLSGILQVVFG